MLYLGLGECVYPDYEVWHVLQGLLMSKVGCMCATQPLSSSSILLQRTDFIMDSLHRTIGYPPYSLDRILPLLDEASSLISNPEKTSAPYRDTLIQIAESLENLAYLVDYRLAETFPQIAVMPDPDAVGWFEAHANVYVPRTERDILNSIGPKALLLRGCLFDESCQPSRTSRSTPGTARLCQCCNWPFQRLARRLTRRRHVVPGHIRNWPSRDLLAIDEGPDFPVLQERSRQGCDFCGLIRKQMLSLLVELPEASDGERHSVPIWIDLSWSSDGRSLERVEVDFRGHSPPYSGKCLYFTVDTTNGGCPGVIAVVRG